MLEILKLPILLAIFLMVGPAASAATKTLYFDGVGSTGGGCDSGYFDVHEKGFVIGNCPQSFEEAGTIHLDQAYAWNDYVEFSTSGRFRPLSLEIKGLNWDFLDETNYSYAPVSYDNVVLTGYVGGALVATQLLSTFDISTNVNSLINAGTFVVSPTLHNIDVLRVAVRLPTAADYASHPMALCIDFPCSHITLRSLKVDVAPVPLPAAGVLFAGALAGLVAARRVSRRPGSR